ncbi:MAG TPA: hypothetical protein VFU21_23410 [Kofleriaceae bacterium]|jgi:hypothetical protein|nr:hypothetical protein [Kofleriaceae bacterium]
MAARKVKSAATGRARKKSAKSSAVRGRGAKAAAKRTRRAASPGGKSKAKSAVKSPRARAVEPVVAAAERKPAKKAEPRPQRPPAVLPIPQSTFFF